MPQRGLKPWPPPRKRAEKKIEEQPTLACPHCRRMLTGTQIGTLGPARHGNVIIQTIPMRYNCEDCNMRIIVQVALHPEPETVDFGVHYVTSDFTLKPLV